MSRGAFPGYIMTVDSLAIGKYGYIHSDDKGSCQAVDAHHVLVQKSSSRHYLLYLTNFLLVAHTSYLLLFKLQEHSVAFFPWNILFGVFLLKAVHGKSIKKESVVIMPGFGVQLETHFCSGRVIRRFVPIGKILKPVLNECVTPVTCYWSLALILRGETELMLVFQELQPPLKMLVPIWKALCAASDSKESMSMVYG